MFHVHYCYSTIYNRLQRYDNLIETDRFSPCVSNVYVSATAQNSCQPDSCNLCFLIKKEVGRLEEINVLLFRQTRVRRWVGVNFS